MRYRKKPQEFDAVQFRSDITLEELPGNLRLRNQRGKTFWVVGKQGNLVKVNPGQWIVVDSMGTLSVLDEEEFAMAYEPVPKPAPAKKSTSAQNRKTK